MALLRLAALAKHLLILDRRRLRCLELVRLLHDKLVQTFIVRDVSGSCRNVIMPSTFLLRLLGCISHCLLL